MEKAEFLCRLKNGLNKFDKDEVNEVINYYNEMICDKMDGGMSESSAVDSFGSVETIIRNVTGEMLQRTKKTSNMTAVGIILATCLSPILFPLLIVAVVLYVVFFVVWIALIVAFGLSGITVIVCGFIALFWQSSVGANFMMGLGVLGICLVVGSILLMLEAGIRIGGSKLLTLINHSIGKAISRKNSKKENK